MDSTSLTKLLSGPSGKAVPGKGRKDLDKRKFVFTVELLSVPDTAAFANRHGYMDTQELQKMFDNYYEDIVNKFTYLYGSASVVALTNIDDYMISFTDLYSLCDVDFRFSTH